MGNKAKYLSLIKTVVITLFIFSYMPSTKADKVDRFIQRLKDKDPNARVVAADTLGEIKDASAVGPLIDALKDENPDVRESAADALMVITDEEFEEDPAKWQEWWEENKKKIHK